MPKNCFRNRAQRNLAQPGSRVSTHHDQVDILLLGDLLQFLPHVAPSGEPLLRNGATIEGPSLRKQEGFQLLNIPGGCLGGDGRYFCTGRSES